ncbi:hypothetical protein GCM10009564_22460 [Streptomyces thermogriseus]|uniref:Uncharacterized protein n=1 Tax=Streptomyces thermogriseus TaxID=75292 RepID=A0ABN1SXT3_9ACTN
MDFGHHRCSRSPVKSPCLVCQDEARFFRGDVPADEVRDGRPGRRLVTLDLRPGGPSSAISFATVFTDPAGLGVSAGDRVFGHLMCGAPAGFEPAHTAPETR